MWHHLALVFSAVVMALVVAGFLAVCLFLAWQIVVDLRGRLAVRRVRRQLITRGRFRAWSDVVETFSQGRGTLIVQYATAFGLYHGGPILEWWTDDDVVRASPVLLPYEGRDPPTGPDLQALVEYSCAVALKYTDLDSGAAALTSGPEPTDWIFDRQPFLTIKSKPVKIGGRRLCKMYPNGNVVTLFVFNGNWMLALGDSEQVIRMQHPET